MSSASDFVIENGVLKKYVGPGGDVVIPVGVTVIGDWAFFKCTNLMGITIPEGVISIGRAFAGCENLTSVNIPRTVTTIGGSAFSECKSLERIVIPEGVTSIGRGAFSFCRNLKDITIPDSVSEIDEGAFHVCPGLADEKGFVIFKGILFDYSGPGGDIVIPEGVTRISANAFEFCRELKHIDIPDGVLYIGEYAFSNCTGLADIAFPDGLAYIGDSAFADCGNLTDVTIPDSIQYIGREAFKDCERVHFTASESAKALIQQFDFDIEETVLKKYSGSGGDVFIPEGVTVIDRGAFGYCKITSVTIPRSVTMIRGSGQRTIGAFWHCTNLKKVTILASQLSIVKDSFYNCENLKEVFAPNLNFSVLKEAGLGMQAAAAFVNRSREYSNKAVQADYIRYVSSQRKKLLPLAYGQDNTDILKLLAGAKKIDKKNLEQDYLLPAVQAGAVKCAEYLKLLGASLGMTLDNLTQADQTKKPASKASGFRIRNGVLIEYKGPGGDVDIPAGVTSIGDGAFSDCETLTNVTIPEGVTSIGNLAFSYCGNLVSVTIPEGVTVIGSEAFAECEKLTDICLPASMNEIWWGAFRDCCSLTSIVIPAGVRKIGWRVFENCSGLTNVVIQNSEACYDDTSFDGCSGLADRNGFVIVNDVLFGFYGSSEEITIPGSVRSVAGYAFYNCSGIKIVHMEEGVTEIGENAFKNCRDLQVNLPGSIRKAKSAFSGCSCKVRVKRWSSAITRLMADAYLDTVVAEDYAGFPPEKLLARALSLSKEKNWEPGAQNESAMLAALRKNVGKLCKIAMEDAEKLCFLCDYNLITAKEIDAFVAEADENGDVEKKAALLQYQNKLGFENVSKARAKKEKVRGDYENALVERTVARDPSKGIEGMTFVITGKLEVWESRNAVKEYLESYGAHLGGSVTKKTDYLVTNDMDSGSEKNRKAKEYGALIISESDFNDMIGKRYKDSVHITVPGWIRSIPDSAFINCASLQSVVLLEGVTSIGRNLFCNCKIVTSLTIPASVTSIYSGFSFCSNLTIHAPAGSYAEQFAKKNKIPFVAE